MICSAVACIGMWCAVVCSVLLTCALSAAVLCCFELGLGGEGGVGQWIDSVMCHCRRCLPVTIFIVVI